MEFAATCGNIRVLVTGGTGLVGKAIESVVSKDEASSQETWIFLSSRDGDLRFYQSKNNMQFFIRYVAIEIGKLQGRYF